MLFPPGQRNLEVTDDAVLTFLQQCGTASEAGRVAPGLDAGVVMQPYFGRE